MNNSNPDTQQSMFEHLESSQQSEDARRLECVRGECNCQPQSEVLKLANQYTIKTEMSSDGRVFAAGIAEPILGNAKREYEQNVVRELLYGIIGEDASREGLRETPKRVVKAWKEMTAGYAIHIGSLFKAFEDGAEGCDQMVVRQGIPVYSNCEHHLLPIFGHATVAYIPKGKVIGLSKMDRVVDALARRLQVQERLTNQIADAFVEHLDCHAVGVIIRARHMCVEARGAKSADSMTRTIALRGEFRSNEDARREFLALDK